MKSGKLVHRSVFRLTVLAFLAAPLLSACGFGSFNTKTKFSSSEYGVAASPRVAFFGAIPKGGGRYMVGQPYKVAGRWYTPVNDPNYEATGVASWYGENFHGRLTANGEVFDASGISGASPVLPLPSYVRVTNLENGRSMLVRINDRGPYAPGRIVDLSERTAELLDFKRDGTARVRVQYVGQAPLEGDDTRMLLASLNSRSPVERQSDMRVASVAPDVVSPAPAPVRAAPQLQTLQPMPPLAGNTTTVNLLSYAETPASGRMIDSAISATEAMATRAQALSSWRNSMDVSGREIKLELGVFADPAAAEQIGERFAVLGAVSKDPVSLNGAPATRLLLTYLRPGVTRDDVADLVRELGLRDAILY